MKIKEGYRLYQLGTEGVVIPACGAGQDSVLALSGSGVMLWAMISSGCSPDDMAASLRSRYGISADEAKSDINDFVSSLRTRGIVE